MSTKRWLVIILSFASMVGLSIWIARAGLPPDTIRVHVPWWAHLLAFGAMAGEVITRAYKIGWSAKALAIELPIGLSIRTCLGGDFGATISPSRSGAEPARFLILAEGGLKPADVLMVLFLEIFLETGSLAVVAVVLYVLFPSGGQVVEALVAVVGGYAVFAVAVGIVGYFMAHHSAHGPPPGWALKVGLRAGRWRRVQMQLRQLRISIDNLRHARVGMMIASFLASIVHVAFRLTILPILVLSLGVVTADLAQLVMWPVMLLYAGPLAPAPGGGGVVELAFKRVLGATIPHNVLGASLIWWRFYTYYLYVLLGGIAAGATVLRAMKRQEEEKKLGPQRRPGVPHEAPPSPRSSGFLRSSSMTTKRKP